LRRLLLAVGNPGRGDDGLGLAFAAAVEARIAGGALPDVDVAHAYQLDLDDALRLAGYDAVLLADAAVDASAPFELRQVEAATTVPWTTHGFGPAALVAVAQALHGRVPSVRLLALRGATFGLGAELSPTAQEALSAALAWLDGGGWV